mmetsp:Transcript_15911/g.39093  ORF Transcript_15911/g.39093 Transcript_15911/m.39093 type:complete len:154 (-) Transcript_15911:232-693(-)
MSDAAAGGSAFGGVHYGQTVTGSAGNYGGPPPGVPPGVGSGGGGGGGEYGGSAASSAPLQPPLAHYAPPSASSAPPMPPSFPGGYDPRRAYPPPAPPSNLPPVSYADGISVAHVAESQKFAKFAVSALGFEDVPTAVENLRKALALLTGQSQP